MATVLLDVNLNTSPAPGKAAVEISNRSAKAASADKIKWKPAQGAPAFTFSNFQPQSTPFDNVDVASGKIECDFNPPAGDPENTEYPYTVYVTFNGDTYDSDEPDTQPTGGRAVIRN